MKGLIVSSNALFIEVVSQALTKYFTDGYVLIDPEHASQGIEENSPDLILIDESMHQETLSKTLSIARLLNKAHIILINPETNDCLVVKSYLATITNLEEFMETIVSEAKQLETDTHGSTPHQCQIDAQKRAELYHFIASIINQKPDSDFVRKLCSVGVEAFTKILEEEGINANLKQGISLTVGYIQEMAYKPEEKIEQELSVDWTRLFRGVSPGYGPPPPNEALYRNPDSDPSQFLQTLMREYAEAGAQIDPGAGNRADYLGLELAFVSFLASEEVKAWQSGETGLAENLASTTRDFIHHHPAAWVDAYCEKALPEAQIDFYRGYLLILKSILQGEV